MLILAAHSSGSQGAGVSANSTQFMLPCLQKLSCCWLGVTILKHCSAVSSQWWQPRKAWGRGKMRVTPHTEDFVDVKLPDNPVVVVQRASVLFIPFFYPSLSCSLLALIVHSMLGLFLLITPQHSLWFSSQIVNHLSWVWSLCSGDWYCSLPVMVSLFIE